MDEVPTGVNLVKWQGAEIVQLLVLHQRRGTLFACSYPAWLRSKNHFLMRLTSRKDAMRTIYCSLFVLLITGCPLNKDSASSTSVKSPPTENVMAQARLAPASGSSAEGTLRFVKAEGGLIVTGSFSGVKPPGLHGLHIHENGNCSSKDASSAGDHFNPAGREHGAPNAQVTHLGDLGNIQISQEGTGQLHVFLKDESHLNENVGGWDVIIGKAVILHEKADDFQTQPSGNSGNRISCGVITKADKVSEPAE